MGNDSLGGDVVVVAEQFELSRRTDVCDMQPGSVGTGQLDGMGRRPEACLTAADERMQRHVGIVAVARLCLSHVGVYDVCVLTMHHYRHCGRAEYLAQGVVLIDKHIAGACSHKQFHARNNVPVERLYGVCIVVGGSEEEAVIHMTLLPGYPELPVEGLERRCLRHSVGHVEECGDTSESRRRALRLDVGLRRKARLAEMHMTVYHSWQDKKPCGIHLLVVVATGYFGSFIYFGYDIVLYDQRCVIHTAVVHDSAAIYQCFHFSLTGLASSFGVGAASGATASDAVGSVSGTSFIPFIIA